MQAHLRPAPPLSGDPKQDLDRGNRQASGVALGSRFAMDRAGRTLSTCRPRRDSAVAADCREPARVPLPADLHGDGTAGTGALSPRCRTDSHALGRQGGEIDKLAPSLFAALKRTGGERVLGPLRPRHIARHPEETSKQVSACSGSGPKAQTTVETVREEVDERSHPRGNQSGRHHGMDGGRRKTPVYQHLQDGAAIVEDSCTFGGERAAMP